ncbi:thioredoxin family protein [candidate division WOR-3 bacterium]|uniref:Thioredoxin family protein n=1 Tax=candidate division WOR-3 bacterium TaxID=2052148 RepID=A0A9D5QDU9_UNCW3|nr:thioredoxin family protein [candidate division WOR-3 bacterium]MBD3364425.1 thioredoxin family protein [candidate division WOR-3 bacterium]
MSKVKIEVFVSSCLWCEETIQLVKMLAPRASDVTVYSMHEEASQEKARDYGITSLPVVVTNGKLSEISPKTTC